MKTTSIIILGLCCNLFTGCRTNNTASSRVPATPESIAKKVEQLRIQTEHMEQLATRSPYSSPDLLKAIHDMRIEWEDYPRQQQETRAKLAAQGIVIPDERFYQAQEEFLDGMSHALQQMEEQITNSTATMSQTPNTVLKPTATSP
jgi:hypothetical protein